MGAASAPRITAAFPWWSLGYPRGSVSVDMTIDCSHVPSPVTSNCTDRWGVGCISRESFRFTTLWNYTRSIQAACANDTRLYGGFSTAQNASLTQATCVEIAGPNWTYYPTPDIWNRLTTWKFPLLQLVATFPRPPLSFKVECFVILHLLGDPIDTIRNLILKMSTCQHTATFWKTECKSLLALSSDTSNERSWEDQDRDWKALAIITDAYGEWDKDGMAQAVLHEALVTFAKGTKDKNDFMTAIRRTGRALAADRSTKFLPIAVAEVFFIAAIGIAIVRTAASASTNALSDTVFINVEAHSIAFSALYFWIIPAVFLSSIIGVSQTEAAIPRILRRFQLDLDRLDVPQKVQMPNQCLEDDQGRIFKGGVYSWRPSQWQWRTPSSSKPLNATLRPTVMAFDYERIYESSAAATNALAIPAALESPSPQSFPPRASDNKHVLLPYPILILGTLTGMFVSAFVPPDGFNCRHLGELLICIAWILSAQVDSFLSYVWTSSSKSDGTLLLITFIKDLIITMATMGGIVVTQIGVFNRCSCYTRWGRMGLTLPERSDVASTLSSRLNTVYPALAFTCIGIELVLVPFYFCTTYSNAVRVYLQRDDRRSNALWVWKAQRRLQATFRPFRKTFSRLHFGRFKLRRAGNSSSTVKPGNTDRWEEMQSLTHMAPETQSQVSSVEPPPPFGYNPPFLPEPRRRNTDPQLGASNAADPSRSHILLSRKPLPGASSLRAH